MVVINVLNVSSKSQRPTMKIHQIFIHVLRFHDRAQSQIQGKKCIVEPCWQDVSMTGSDVGPEFMNLKIWNSFYTHCKIHRHTSAAILGRIKWLIHDGWMMDRERPLLAHPHHTLLGLLTLALHREKHPSDVYCRIKLPLSLMCIFKCKPNLWPSHWEAPVLKKDSKLHHDQEKRKEKTNNIQPVLDV